MSGTIQEYIASRGLSARHSCFVEVSFLREGTPSHQKKPTSGYNGQSKNRINRVKAAFENRMEGGDSLEDRILIDLYWARDEKAIQETSTKYGRLCFYIANNILRNTEDCEECVNDTYFAAWNAIPDKRPDKLSVFLSRITRNLALKKYEYRSAIKRNPSATVSFDELEDCVSGRYNVESEVENQHIESAINEFLWGQGVEKRNIFIRRYWYFDSIETICSYTGFSQSKVKSILYEMRLKLRKYLESEGIEV